MIQTEQLYHEDKIYPIPKDIADQYNKIQKRIMELSKCKDQDETNELLEEINEGNNWLYMEIAKRKDEIIIITNIGN